MLDEDIQRDIQSLQKKSIYIMDKYPNHVLIYLHSKHKKSIHLNKKKYIVINEMLLKDFQKIVSKNVLIDKNHYIYFKINDIIVTEDDLTKTIEEIYNNFVNKHYNENDVKINYIIIEICRSTKYINKFISLLTLQW